MYPRSRIMIKTGRRESSIIHLSSQNKNILKGMWNISYIKKMNKEFEFVSKLGTPPLTLTLTLGWFASDDVNERRWGKKIKFVDERTLRI